MWRYDDDDDDDDDGNDVLVVMMAMLWCGDGDVVMWWWLCGDADASQASPCPCEASPCLCPSRLLHPHVSLFLYSPHFSPLLLTFLTSTSPLSPPLLHFPRLSSTWCMYDVQDCKRLLSMKQLVYTASRWRNKRRARKRLWAHWPTRYRVWRTTSR